MRNHEGTKVLSSAIKFGDVDGGEGSCIEEESVSSDEDDDGRHGLEPEDMEVMRMAPARSPILWRATSEMSVDVCLVKTPKLVMQ